MSGVRNYEGWRWIFIIEGLITVILAVASKWLIVDWPEKANFLNNHERALLLRRLHEDVEDATMDRLDKESALRIFGDWKIYMGFVYLPLRRQRRRKPS